MMQRLMFLLSSGLPAMLLIALGLWFLRFSMEEMKKAGPDGIRICKAGKWVAMIITALGGLCGFLFFITVLASI